MLFYANKLKRIESFCRDEITERKKKARGRSNRNRFQYIYIFVALTFSRIGSGRKRGRRTERRRAPSKLWLGGGVSKTRNEPVKRINVLRGPRTTSIRCALSDLVDDPDPIRFIHPNFSLYRVAILSLSLSPLIFFGCRDFDDSSPPFYTRIAEDVNSTPTPFPRIRTRIYAFTHRSKDNLQSPWLASLSGDYLSSLFLSRPHYSSSSAKFLG